MSFYPIATVVLISDEKEVLLLKRSKPPYDTFYAFPGGKIELGESIKEAAIREITEETGIRLADLELDTILKETYIENEIYKKQFLLFYFLAKLDVSESLIQSREGILSWQPLKDLPSRIVPSDLRILNGMKQNQFQINGVKVMECQLIKIGQSADYQLRLRDWQYVG